MGLAPVESKRPLLTAAVPVPTPVKRLAAGRSQASMTEIVGLVLPFFGLILVGYITARLVRGKLVLISCIDNLIKGASGAAVQNFNLMYGFPETTALY